MELPQNFRATMIIDVSGKWGVGGAKKIVEEDADHTPLQGAVGGVGRADAATFDSRETSLYSSIHSSPDWAKL